MPKQATDPNRYCEHAETYASIGIEDTFYLAYREVAAILRKWRGGRVGLDHGCGAGRSTRFLRDWGFRVVGVDANPDMLQEARLRDPAGDYRQVSGSRLPFRAGRFDLVLQSFVMIEYRSKDELLATLNEFRRVVRDGGVVVIVTADRSYYSLPWRSFIPSARKRRLRSGDLASVRLRGRKLRFLDTYWTDADYHELFHEAGFTVQATRHPRADGTEPYCWISERRHSCWTIYVLRPRRREFRAPARRTLQPGARHGTDHLR